MKNMSQLPQHILVHCLFYRWNCTTQNIKSNLWDPDEILPPSFYRYWQDTNLQTPKFLYFLSSACVSGRRCSTDLTATVHCKSLTKSRMSCGRHKCFMLVNASQTSCMFTSGNFIWYAAIEFDETNQAVITNSDSCSWSRKFSRNYVEPVLLYSSRFP